MCELPLFLVDTHKRKKRINYIVRLLLVGEQSEPMPEEIAVSNSFPDEKILYVGTQQGTLQLYPMLVWGLECDRAAQGIYLVDKVATEKLAYKSLAAFNQPTEPPIPDDLIQVLDGVTVPIEKITLHDGRSFIEPI